MLWAFEKLFTCRLSNVFKIVFLKKMQQFSQKNYFSKQNSSTILVHSTFIYQRKISKK